MKILLITPSLLMGGTERYILNFLKNCKTNEVDVAFFRCDCETMYNAINKYAIHIYQFPYYVKQPIKFIRFMRAFYRKNKYDVVYCHANHGSTIFYTYPLWIDKKTLIMYHSHNSQGNHKLLHQICKNIILKVCTDYFACSEAASIYMYGSKKATIVNNGIDIADYIYDCNLRIKMRKAFGVENNYVIGHVGQFSERKNHRFLLYIFKAVLQKVPDSVLMLVGTGELMDEIRNMAIDLKINQHIIFVGNTSEVNKLYQAFDLFLLPSLYEGLPFVGIEAQASGTCCLLSDSIPFNIKITPLVHFMSLEKSADEWAEYIKQLADEYSHKQDYSEMIESAGFGLSGMKEAYNKRNIKFFT